MNFKLKIIRIIVVVCMVTIISILFELSKNGVIDTKETTISSTAILGEHSENTKVAKDENSICEVKTNETLLLQKETEENDDLNIETVKVSNRSSQELLTESRENEKNNSNNNENLGNEQTSVGKENLNLENKNIDRKNKEKNLDYNENDNRVELNSNNNKNENVSNSVDYMQNEADLKVKQNENNAFNDSNIEVMKLNYEKNKTDESMLARNENETTEAFDKKNNEQNINLINVKNEGNSANNSNKEDGSNKSNNSSKEYGSNKSNNSNKEKGNNELNNSNKENKNNESSNLNKESGNSNSNQGSGSNGASSSNKENEKIKTNSESDLGIYMVNDAKAMLPMLNKARKESGETELVWDSNLENLCKKRAKEIVLDFSHNRPKEAKAENIAYGIITTNRMYKEWMASPSHNKNIMNKKYTKVGIAKYVYDGVCYWAMLLS